MVHNNIDTCVLYRRSQEMKSPRTPAQDRD